MTRRRALPARSIGALGPSPSVYGMRHLAVYDDHHLFRETIEGKTMKKYICEKVVFGMVVIGLLLLFGCGKKEESPTAPGPGMEAFKTISAFDQAQLMGRGVNLGNALEAGADWAIELYESYFQLISEAGFTNVRIPISWALYAQPIPPYLVDETFFRKVDWAIDMALKYNLIAIVNHHHYDELDSDPESVSINSPRKIFLGIWAQIAERYKDYPNSVIFEINNEPHSEFNAQNWDALWRETLAIIREHNPTRNVVVGPIGWNSIYELNTLILPTMTEEPHLIVTFHYYNPHQFTHQGASWAGDAAGNWLGTTWGTNEDNDNVRNDFKTAAEWALGVGRPLYLGEFGAYEMADMDSRVKWTTAIRQTSELYGIPWSYWEFGAGFGIYDRGAQAWRTPLLEALIPPQ